ncbi:T9SS type A sorting domain-containing protein [Constantimarinum furrinae]|uniref:Secretion system C-terminal sorting domain-containing protein n=1 Tax=Constantimarinum furrinae TaxID=2562285 RepID=A0A7G8PXW1_9FLAO|nr:T9SS type A sorting domain-containing protein [Constantimarinum furrinae]QNJ99177.1 hypothetical protein ALE3EI_2650 [Constantimarinum furrinae]
MKTRLLFIVIAVLFTLPIQAQFQKTFTVSNQNFHDLNLEPTHDNTNDFIVAGNLFDTSMQNEVPYLQRLDQNGTVIWFKSYSHTSLVHARFFDLIVVGNTIYVTGSIDVSGTKRVFISQIDASNGNVVATNYYTIVGASFNSRGLKIIHTNSDANNDAVPDPGLVVGGFFSDCYAVNTSCMFNNLGFVLRTDLNLNILWTEELDASNTINSLEYDFVNGITETTDGFFITGSATGTTTGSLIQQAVLAYKIDFQGNFSWDSSYIFGNSSDSSADAYFDIGTNEIYMLVNYSISHYFGVTVLNNTTGAIVPSKSWYASGQDLDRYGFRIMESGNSANNLVISGYDRDENWSGGGASFFGQSNIIVYEFAKATGAQVGTSYQYLVPHVEPAGDEFNFWTGQFPTMYFPDMSQFIVDTAGNAEYYHVGYRTDPSATFTSAEIFRTPLNLRNECENLVNMLNPNAAGFQFTTVTSAGVPNTSQAITLNAVSVSFTESMCDPTLPVQEFNKNTGYFYPNPASEYIHYSTNDLVSFNLYDFSGKLLKTEKSEDIQQIFIGNLNTGMYFIQGEDVHGNLMTFRFIKE